MSRQPRKVRICFRRLTQPSVLQQVLPHELASLSEVEVMKASASLGLPSLDSVPTEPHL